MLADSATVLSRMPPIGSYLGILTDLGRYKGDAFLTRMRMAHGQRREDPWRPHPAR